MHCRSGLIIGPFLCLVSGRKIGPLVGIRPDNRTFMYGTVPVSGRIFGPLLFKLSGRIIGPFSFKYGIRPENRAF